MSDVGPPTSKKKKKRKRQIERRLLWKEKDRLKEDFYKIKLQPLFQLK